MTLNDLLQWWNVIFVLPIVAALLQTVMQGLGLMHFSHGSHLHVGHPHFHLPHTHHQLPAANHGTETHVGHSHPHSDSPGAFMRFMSLLGVGRVPFMTVLSSFALIWGFSGLVCNNLFSMLPHEVSIWFSMAVATLAASTTTGLLSRVLGRLMPNTETYVESESDMVGRFGVANTNIDGRVGTVVLLDTYGNRIELKGFTSDGVIIPRGSRVMLESYDEQSRRFVTREAPKQLVGNLNSQQ